MTGLAQEGKADRIAALLVGLPAVVELALILHHPVAARPFGSAGAVDRFGGIAAVIEANRLFHAVLILLMLAELTGLLLLARRLGFHRTPIMTGSVLSAVGTMMLLLATAYDGFVVFELITRCRASVAGCGVGSQAALAMIFASIQAFTKLGLVAQSLAFCAFAAALPTSAGRLRFVGLAGIVIALIPIALLSAGNFVGPAAIMRILASQALFGTGAALLLGSGRLTEAQ